MPILPTTLEAKTQTLDAEEFANGVTHGIGFLISLVAAPWLISVAAQDGDPWKITGCAIYAFSLVAVFAASTLSHLVQEPLRRRWFRMLDQACIYLLIAGTDTPFCLVYLREGWWWLLFAALWSLALYGFVSKIVFTHRIEQVSAVLYVVLGWLPIVAAYPLAYRIPLGAWPWLCMGGLLYCFGLIFWFLSDHLRYAHALWHIMVIFAATCHYLGILYYVAL